MKRILLIAANGFSKSGVPTVFMNIVRNLSKRGYVFDIIYFSDKDDFYKEEFLSYGGKVFLFNKEHHLNIFNKLQRYISGPKYYRKTLKIINENGPYEAVHSFAEYNGCHFFKAAFKANVKMRIYHVNNCVNPGGNIVNVIMSKREKRLCLKYANKFVGCSSEACKVTLGKNVQYTVIPNPYDDSKFSFSLTNHNKHQQLVLVQTGFYSSIKNQLFSLSVLREILNANQDAVIHFVGFEEEQGYKNQMNEKIEKLALKEKVFLQRKDTNLPELYKDCDCMLLPSISEAFGIVLIEAQAVGMSCFVSNVVPRESNVGGCVYLDLKSGAKYWAQTIINWYTSSANKRVYYDCSTFSPKKITSQYLSLYNFQMEKNNV